MAAEEKTALRCHFRGSLRQGERAVESAPRHGGQTYAATRSTTDFIVQLEQRGRGVLPGGGASHSKARLPTLGPRGRFSESPSVGLLLLTQRPGLGTQQPELSTRILLWSGSTTQRGAHASRFGLEVGPGSGA